MLTQRMNFAVNESDELRKELDENNRIANEHEQMYEKMSLELERRNEQAALFEIQHESLVNQVKTLTSSNSELKSLFSFRHRVFHHFWCRTSNMISCVDRTF